MGVLCYEGDKEEKEGFYVMKEIRRRKWGFYVMKEIRRRKRGGSML